MIANLNDSKNFPARLEKSLPIIYEGLLYHPKGVKISLLTLGGTVAGIGLIYSTAILVSAIAITSIIYVATLYLISKIDSYHGGEMARSLLLNGLPPDAAQMELYDRCVERVFSVISRIVPIERKQFDQDIRDVVSFQKDSNGMQMVQKKEFFEAISIFKPIEEIPSHLSRVRSEIDSERILWREWEKTSTLDKDRIASMKFQRIMDLVQTPVEDDFLELNFEELDEKVDVDHTMLQLVLPERAIEVVSEESTLNRAAILKIIKKIKRIDRPNFVIQANKLATPKVGDAARAAILEILAEIIPAKLNLFAGQAQSLINDHDVDETRVFIVKHLNQILPRDRKDFISGLDKLGIGQKKPKFRMEFFELLLKIAPSYRADHICTCQDKLDEDRIDLNRIRREQIKLDRSKQDQIKRDPIEQDQINLDRIKQDKTFPKRLDSYKKPLLDVPDLLKERRIMQWLSTPPNRVFPRLTESDVAKAEEDEKKMQDEIDLRYYKS